MTVVMTTNSRIDFIISQVLQNLASTSTTLSEALDSKEALLKRQKQEDMELIRVKSDLKSKEKRASFDATRQSLIEHWKINGPPETL